MTKIKRAGEILISIVIPVFNEEENVTPLFSSIKEVMMKVGEKYEVIFVDDGSKDRTLSNLKEILTNGTEPGELRILELQRNYGQTPALLAGLDNVRGDVVVTLDGDLQNDPNDIPKLLNALDENCDVVCGWRKSRQDNFLKKLPSRFNNFLNRKLNNVDIHDSGCTMRAYRSEAVKGMHLYAEGHRYIPAILAKQGFRLREVETDHKPRIMGKTKYGIKRLFRGFNDLLTLKALHKWGTKPGHLFNIWAVLFIFFSFLTGVWTVLERVLFYRFWSFYSEPVFIRSNPFLIISIMLFLFGFLLIFLGFLAELFYRKTTDSRNSYQIKKEWKKDEELPIL